jgi:hypothetical protein
MFRFEFPTPAFLFDYVHQAEFEQAEVSMRVKLSGSIETVEALETALQVTEGSSLEVPATRHESAELRFGVKEWGEIIVAAKGFAEVVSLCWAGIQVLRRTLSERTAPSEASISGPKVATSAPVTLEVTTAGARVRVAIPLDSTREQIKKQLSPLQSKEAR